MNARARARALVTGAGRGLGKAIALELAARGHHVFAGVRAQEAGAALLREAESLPGAVELQVIDVAALGDYTPPEDLDILINNAGYRGPYLPIEEAGMDEWQRTFATNFFGVVDLTRRVVPGMRRARSGVICNVGSLGATTPLPFYSIYRTSKVAVSALTEALRIELAPFGVRVIEIPIGGVDTDMFRSSIAHRAPDAVEYEAYRPMAEQQLENSKGIGASAISAEAAACNLVDELFRPGPMRRACDPNAVKGLTWLAQSSEEERLATMLARFKVDAP
ncbi:MAG: SDR family NAD(P)-dependent oxidoreductase [Pseudomonadota bacterium]